MKKSFISAVLVLVAGAAGAFVIDPGMPAFSMIGITRGQMAQPFVLPGVLASGDWNGDKK